MLQRAPRATAPTSQMLRSLCLFTWSRSPPFCSRSWLNFRSFCNMQVEDSPAKRQRTEATNMTNGTNGVNGARYDHNEVETSAMSAAPVLRYAKISPDAHEPVRGTDQSAGYDLFSNKNMTVPSKGKALVPTDIKIALPEGCYGRIAPRSGLACKKFIDVGAGVIDRDYRGNVKVLLFNFSDEDFEVNKGDRIAQLICERIFMPDLQECEDLEATDRGAGGFGSTGTN